MEQREERTDGRTTGAQRGGAGRGVAARRERRKGGDGGAEQEADWTAGTQLSGKQTTKEEARKRQGIVRGGRRGRVGVKGGGGVGGRRGGGGGGQKEEEEDTRTQVQGSLLSLHSSIRSGLRNQL